MRRGRRDRLARAQAQRVAALPATLPAAPRHRDHVHAVAAPAVLRCRALESVTFARFADADLRDVVLHGKSSCRHVVLGGEAFPPMDWLLRVWPLDSRAQLHNIYGVTELSCWATMHTLRRADVHASLRVPVGEPLGNTELQIRDGSGAAITGAGDLFLGSATRFCLVGDEQAPVRWRFSGDVAEEVLSAAGQRAVYWLGRKGRTVKHLGQLVRLDEVEHCIERVLGVPACHMMSAAADTGEQQLLCFVQAGRGLDVSGLRRDAVIVVIDHISAALLQLLHALPPQCVPAAIHPVDEMPLTANGKIDASALAALHRARLDAAPPAAAPAAMQHDTALRDWFLAAVRSIIGRFPGLEPSSYIGYSRAQQARRLPRPAATQCPPRCWWEWCRHTLPRSASTVTCRCFWRSCLCCRCMP